MIEEEEVLSEDPNLREPLESTVSNAESRELIPQPENTVILWRRVATFKVQKEAPSAFHPGSQLITIAEATTPKEVEHVLSNGASMFEMELIADAGRMWGLDSGSAGDEGELMDMEHSCGARIRTKYVWGLTHNDSRL